VAESGLLTRAQRRRVEKPGRPVAPQVGDDDPIPGSRQGRYDAVVGMDVIGKAVHQHDRATVCRAVLDIGDVEDRGVGGLHDLNLKLGPICVRSIIVNG
jgi:hypothetical protein